MSLFRGARAALRTRVASAPALGRDRSMTASVESVVAGGEGAFGAGDVARAVACFAEAVAVLSHLYVDEGVRPRPRAADERVLTGLVGSVHAARDAQLDTVAGAAVWAAVEDLDAIAVQWATHGFDPEAFIAARESVIALTGRLAEPSEAVARLGAWEALQMVPDQGDREGPTNADILREWTLGGPTEDLLRWCQGIRQYEDAPLDDSEAMRHSAELMAPALAHFVGGRTISPQNWAKDPNADIGLTTWNVLVATLEGREPATWDGGASRCIRVALAAARHAGLQPQEMGGSGALTRLFGRRNRLLMCGALSDDPLAFRLGAWFQSEEPVA